MQDPRPREAAFAILSAMAILGLIDNFVVHIAERGSLWQFHALRSAMALVLLAAFAALAGHDLRPQRAMRVAVRGLPISTSMVLCFGSLAFLPPGQAAAGGGAA